LCPLETGELVGAMCLGTPHFSRHEFTLLAQAVVGKKAAPGVEVYVSTSREIAADVRTSWEFQHLEHFGVRTVVDTCPYVASIVRRPDGAIVTNSAKFAHYAPGVMRRRVGLMTLERCVRSAELGKVPAP
jgi:predicted aconitase